MKYILFICFFVVFFLGQYKIFASSPRRNHPEVFSAMKRVDAIVESSDITYEDIVLLLETYVDKVVDPEKEYIFTYLLTVYQNKADPQRRSLYNKLKKLWVWLNWYTLEAWFSKDFDQKKCEKYWWKYSCAQTCWYLWDNHCEEICWPVCSF